MPTLPPGRPKITRAQLHQLIAPFAIDRERHPLIVVGIRGYFLDGQGQPGQNDRGLYDDAIFIDSDHASVAYNGNTDPTRYRAGQGTGRGKGMASLKPGCYYAHKFDEHDGRYLALCQRLGAVTVIRDGHPPYPDTGTGFGINIHRGADNSTSSEGCQTLPPAQWPSFIALATDLAQRYFGGDWEDTVIPYALVENTRRGMPAPAGEEAAAAPTATNSTARPLEITSREKPRTGPGGAAGPFAVTTNLKDTASPLTAEGVRAFFAAQADPEKRGLAGIGGPVLAAAEKYGIHASYIVAHAILETGWGTSRIYREKHNLFGWSAYDDSPYDSAEGFPDDDACIDFVMGRVNGLYLTKGGRYFHTAPCVGEGYGSGGYGMNRAYASDPEWGVKIARIARRLEEFTARA